MADVSRHPCRFKLFCESVFLQKGEKVMAGSSLSSMQVSMRLLEEAEELCSAICCGDIAVRTTKISLTSVLTPAVTCLAPW